MYFFDVVYGIKEIWDRLGVGVVSNVYVVFGLDGNIDSFYEFFGISVNYIEFLNGVGLDVKNFMMMLCWLFLGG